MTLIWCSILHKLVTQSNGKTPHHGLFSLMRKSARTGKRWQELREGKDKDGKRLTGCLSRQNDGVFIALRPLVLLWMKAAHDDAELKVPHTTIRWLALEPSGTFLKLMDEWCSQLNHTRDSEMRQRRNSWKDWPKETLRKSSQRVNLWKLQNPEHHKHRDTQDLVDPSTDIQMVDHILTCPSDVLHNPFRTILLLRCSSFTLLVLRSSSSLLLPRLPSAFHPAQCVPLAQDPRNLPAIQSHRPRHSHHHHHDLLRPLPSSCVH